LRTIDVPGAPGAPSRKATRVYVTCFQSNQIMVVDPDLSVVTDTILVGRGPNDLVFSDGPSITGGSRPRRGFVTNFSEMTIGVIDLEPGSITENRMIARIGVPVPPPLP
jgi:YVTN family beta-propeller protein